jgi:mono/diheme cytochrome c family protein
MKHVFAVAALVLFVPLAIWAAEQKSITLPPDDAFATLKPGPAMEVTRANCVNCHSADYVILQPRGDAKQWQAVVTKMIKVFGAPIAPENEKPIVEYLSSAYGPAK